MTLPAVSFSGLEQWFQRKRLTPCRQERPLRCFAGLLLRGLWAPSLAIAELDCCQAEASPLGARPWHAAPAEWNPRIAEWQALAVSEQVCPVRHSCAAAAQSWRGLPHR